MTITNRNLSRFQLFDMVLGARYYATDVVERYSNPIGQTREVCLKSEHTLISCSGYWNLFKIPLYAQMAGFCGGVCGGRQLRVGY
jgi:hypothetical protein